MYKVFVNEHLIELTDSPKFYPLLKDQIFVNSIISEELKVLIEYLLQNDTATEIELYFSDLEEGFKEFKNSFQLIEAAGGLVRNKDGKELFIYRLGKWDLPKGKIERGESSEIAALREVEEECGIGGLKIVGQLKNTWHIYSHKGKYVLKCTHWYSMEYHGDEELVPQGEEGIEKVIWMDEKEKSKCLNNTYSSILELLS